MHPTLHELAGDHRPRATHTRRDTAARRSLRHRLDAVLLRLGAATVRAGLRISAAARARGASPDTRSGVPRSGTPPG